MEISKKFGKVCRKCKLRKGGLSASKQSEGGQFSRCMCDQEKTKVVSVSKCFDCGKEVDKGVFRCEDCLNVIIERDKPVRRRPMSEWESMKSEFYKSDKKWEENIKSRKVVNGVTMYQPKPGVYRPLPTPQKRQDGTFY